METRFLNLSKEQDMATFKEAINALNNLIEFYQDKKNSKQGEIISLERPWKKVNLWGGDGVGIGGYISIKSDLNELHSLFKNLYNMGFQVETHELTNYGEAKGYKFSSALSVCDARFIAEIPEKCKQIIEINHRVNSEMNIKNLTLI